MLGIKLGAADRMKHCVDEGEELVLSSDHFEGNWVGITYALYMAIIYNKLLELFKK